MRIHHVNVVVPDGRTDDVVPFYELLGATRVPKPTEGVARAGAWLDLPAGTQVHVSERAGAPHPQQHFAVVVPHFDELVRRLTAAGHPWTPGTLVGGARRGMTADPCGNAVEVLEDAGPYAHRAESAQTSTA